jgi:hypothetical protein
MCKSCGCQVKPDEGDEQDGHGKEEQPEKKQAK